MGYYKIKNLTNSFNKRDVNKDKVIKIELQNKYEKNVFNLKIDDTLLVEFSKLPIKLHKYRMKGFISIVEISKNDFLKHIKPPSQLKTISVEKDTPIKKEIVEVEKKKELIKVKSKKIKKPKKDSLDI